MFDKAASAGERPQKPNVWRKATSLGQGNELLSEQGGCFTENWKMELILILTILGGLWYVFAQIAVPCLLVAAWFGWLDKAREAVHRRRDPGPSAH